MDLDHSCQQASELKNSNYSNNCLVKSVICCLGVGLTIIGVKREGFAWLVHPNAKVLFFFHVFLIICIETGHLVSYMADVLRLAQHVSTPCDYVMTEAKSFWVKFPGVFASNVQSYAMAAFAIERAIATNIPKTYEKKRKPYLACALILTSILISSSVTYAFLIAPNKYTSTSVVSSEKTVDNSSRFQIWLYSYTIVEACTFLLTLYCYLHSRSLLRKVKGICKEAELGLKYQSRENLTIIKFLIPCFFLHVIFHLIAAVAVTVYLWAAPNKSQVDYITMTEYFYVLPFYGVFMPLALIGRSKKQNKEKAATVFVISKKGEEYFEGLRQQWSTIPK